MCLILCVIINQLFTSMARIINSIAGTLLQTQGIIADFLKMRRYLQFWYQRKGGTWLLQAWLLTGYGRNSVLLAKASFQFSCSVNHFVPPYFWYSSCHLSPLACHSHSHLTILSLLSFIKDVLLHLISTCCFFLFLHIITRSHWFLLQPFHSNFSVNLCLSFTSTSQDPHL